MDKQWAAEMGGRSLHSHSCSRGNRSWKKNGSCLENTLCSIPSMRLSTSLHECIVDIQCHYLLLFTSPSEQSSLVVAFWVPNITSTNAIPLYNLLVINVLLCYSVLLMLGNLCAELLHLQRLEIQDKSGCLYSEMGIYSVSATSTPLSIRFHKYTTKV